MMTKLFAYLSYQDAPAALDWMERVGFEVVRREDGAGGRVIHAEKSASAMQCWHGCWTRKDSSGAPGRMNPVFPGLDGAAGVGPGRHILLLTLAVAGAVQGSSGQGCFG